jgi:hypothetical protein
MAKNDKKKKVADGPIVKQISEQFDNFHVEADTWEKDLFIPMMNGQYPLIESLMTITDYVTANKDRQLAFSQYLSDQKINFNGTPSAGYRVAKAAYPNNPKLASSHGKVITAARLAGKTSADVRPWVAGQGGIESIRLGKKGENRDDLIKAGTDKLKETQAIAEFERTAETPADGGEVLMYGSVDKEGVTTVLAFSRNEGLIKSFKERIGREMDKVKDDQKGTKTFEDVSDEAVAEDLARLEAEAETSRDEQLEEAA